LRGVGIRLVPAATYYDDDEGKPRRRLPRGADPLGLREHLASLTSLGHERWKRAHPRSGGRWGSGSFTHAAPTTPTLADLPAEVAVDRIPERRGEIERLREPTTSAAAQSSVRRTSVRFVDSSRPEGPRPGGPCPGEPP